MSKHIVPIISELLFYRRSSNEETADFVEKGWKHDKYLCPWLTKKLNIIRESFLKFQSEAYDIQGIHDLGTDIVLRYAPSDDLEEVERRYVAFQIKSHEDLARPDYLKELRSQYTQAVGEYRDRLEKYYVLLCGDMNRYQGKVREINKTMTPHDRVVVIEPGYSHGFFNLNTSKIWSVVDLYFREQDEVLIEAKKLIGQFPPTHAAIAIAAIYEATFNAESSIIDPESVAADSFINDVYEVVPDYDDFDLAEEMYFSGLPLTTNNPTEDDDEVLHDLERPFELRWAEDTGLLMDGLLNLEGFGTHVRVDVGYGRPIQALLVDANVRYGYQGSTLCEYVFELLGVLDRFGLAMPSSETGRPTFN